MNSNPIHQDSVDKKWYFYDETWSDRLGPYDTEQEATEACRRYAEGLDRQCSE